MAGWFYADNLSANQEQVLWRADSMTATGLDICARFLEDSKLKFSRRHYHTGTMSYSTVRASVPVTLCRTAVDHFLVMDDFKFAQNPLSLDGVLLGFRFSGHDRQ